MKFCRRYILGIGSFTFALLFFFVFHAFAADVTGTPDVNIVMPSTGIVLQLNDGASTASYEIAENQLTVVTGSGDTTILSSTLGYSLTNNANISIQCVGGGTTSQITIQENRTIIVTPTATVVCAGNGGAGGGGGGGGPIAPLAVPPPAPVVTPVPTEEPIPEEAVPVEEEGELTGTQGGGYSGADAPSWAEDSVDEACERSLIDCTLKPQFETVLNRAVGYQMLTKGFAVLANTAKSPLSDVDTLWYEQAAHSAYTLHWTAGVNGKFLGAESFSRTQISVAVNAIVGLPKASLAVLDVYTDKDKIPSWGTQAVSNMVQAKLIGQGGNKLLRPNDGISKLEAIVVLNAAVTYSQNKFIDVLKVAGDRMGVTKEIVQKALLEGKNIVDGALVEVQ